MPDTLSVQNRIAALFAGELHLVVPSVETDLIDTGVLDSLKFVELLVLLERTFGGCFTLGDLQIENFRSIQKIAEFIVQRNGSRK